MACLCAVHALECEDECERAGTLTLRPERDLGLFSPAAPCLAALEERGSSTYVGVHRSRFAAQESSQYRCNPQSGLQACAAMPDSVDGSRGLELCSTRLQNKQSLPQDFLSCPDMVLLNTEVLS